MPAARPKNQYMPGLQVGRGVAALLVLLYHACTLVREDGMGWVYIEYIGKRGVDFFFVLSGFIIYLIHRRDIGNPPSLKRFVLKRTLRIYPPYWVLVIVYLAFYAAFLRDGLHDQLMPLNVIKGLVLYPVNGKPYNIPTAWTLSHEMLFYLLFATAILNRRVGVLVLGIWSLAILCAIPFFPLNFPASFLLNPRNLEFFMGMAVAHLISSGRVTSSRSLLFLGIATFLSIGGAEIWTSGFKDGPAVLLYGLASAVVIYASSALDYAHKAFHYGRSALIVGDASYSIYIVHFPIVLLLSKLVDHYVHLRSVWLSDITILVMVFSGTMAGIAFYWVIEKPLLKRTTQYSGMAPKRKTAIQEGVA